MKNIAAALSFLVLSVCLMTCELAGQPSPNSDSDCQQLRNITLQAHSVTMDPAIQVLREDHNYDINGDPQEHSTAVP